MYDILLKNANIIDHEGKIHKNLNIYIKDQLIDKITEEVDEELSNETIDCSNYFVTPGLVNLHTHSPMNIFKGIAEDVHIDDWFSKEIWPYESKMKPNDVYIGALAAIIEMIDNGVTAFADHYMFADKICDAVIETGIKADIATTLFGMNENFMDHLEEASNLIIEKNSISNRLNVRMGPHAPYTCPADTLKTIIDKAKDLNLGIHIHVSETNEQVEESIKTYGKTPFERLYTAGGFDIPCIIAHGLWIKEDDRKYLNSNVHIAACPKTYMKLSMGYGHIWDNSNELPLCTGTDGAASSNALDPLEQARLFALVGKFIKNDSTDFTINDIWKMIMRGHEALPFNSGRIEEKYAADLVIWNLKTQTTTPLYNPLASIIYSSNSSNILYNIVNGKILKRNGIVESVSNDIVNKLTNVSKNILNRGKGKTTLIF